MRAIIWGASQTYRTYPGPRFSELNWLEWGSGTGGEWWGEPAGGDRVLATRSYVQSWRDLVLAAKIQQLCYIDRGELQMPDLPRSWPKVRSLEEMPCALWLQL